MFAQVVKFNIQPGKVDEVLAVFKESVIPAVQQQKGFKNAYMLMDRSANKGLGLSLWETEADLEAMATSGFYQEQVAKLAPFFSGPPEREVYEVGAQV